MGQTPDPEAPIWLIPEDSHPSEAPPLAEIDK